VARIESPDSPDILFSFRWRAGANENGAEGVVVGEGRKPGFGTHASLSRFDFHNTLVAAGPDIRAGFRDEFPTANVDVAPTIFRILGVTPPGPVDGRVLNEALASVDFDAPKPETKFVTATCPTVGGTWQQYLKTITFGDHTYLDEGNFGPAPE
jgi:arylsulfatase A-like enzyme